MRGVDCVSKRIAQQQFGIKQEEPYWRQFERSTFCVRCTLNFSLFSVMSTRNKCSYLCNPWLIQCHTHNSMSGFPSIFFELCCARFYSLWRHKCFWLSLCGSWKFQLHLQYAGMFYLRTGQYFGQGAQTLPFLCCQKRAEFHTKFPSGQPCIGHWFLSAHIRETDQLLFKPTEWYSRKSNQLFSKPERIRIKLKQKHICIAEKQAFEKKLQRINKSAMKTFELSGEGCARQGRRTIVSQVAASHNEEPSHQWEQWTQ